MVQIPPNLPFQSQLQLTPLPTFATILLFYSQRTTTHLCYYISKLETQDYTPSIDQLQALAECLGFEPTELFIDSETHPFSAHPAIAAKGTAKDATSTATDATETNTLKPYNIAVAGTGYVGLSLAVLLSQHNNVTAVDIIPEKVEKINNFESPIPASSISMPPQTAHPHTRTPTSSLSPRLRITIPRRTSLTALQ